jgi:hypothetical protein
MMRYKSFALVLVSLPAFCQQSTPPIGTQSLGEQLLRETFQRGLNPASRAESSPNAFRKRLFLSPGGTALRARGNLTALGKAPLLLSQPTATVCSIPLIEVPADTNVDPKMILRHQGPNDPKSGDPKMVLSPPPVCSSDRLK